MAESNGSSNGEPSDPKKDQFTELCHELNMDGESQDIAWASYQRIDQHYMLEGEKAHWMACALYVACRQSAVPTSDKQNTIKGNCVSLTSLLRKTKLSLLHFFQKMKKWLDMTNLGSVFRSRIDLLERNFNVSSIVFKKTEGLFYEVFKEPEDGHGKSSKGRLRKKQVCSVNDVLSFCWTLYIRAKGNFPEIGDDLVNSYHLLLCSLDLMFTNALISKPRRELLNPAFQGLPEDYMSKDFHDDDLPSAIDILCTKFDGIAKESKEIREHHWKPFVKKLITNKILKGNQEILTGLLDSGNFEYNCKHLNQYYDGYVLSTGEIDERIFLGDDANLEIGTPSKSHQTPEDVDESGRSHLKRNLQEHFERTSLAPLTPLTGRKYLRDKDSVEVTPISNATQSVSRLQNHLLGFKDAPSGSLSAMFAECEKNPKEVLDEITSKLEKTFQTAYTQPSMDRPQSPCSTLEFANNRWKLSLVLFYKILENIMKTEKKINQNVDPGNIVSQEIFVRTLMACCLEIVISSYNSQKKFPWILGIFDLSPFHFCKIIEVVIREEEGLSRDVVKHLNRIEESILDKMAWEENSALYDALHNSGDIVPTFESVCVPLPSTGDVLTGSLHSATIVSPVAQRNIYKKAGDKVVGYPIQQSPTAIPLADRFASAQIGSVKRSLFGAAQNPKNSATNMSTTFIATSTSFTLSPHTAKFFSTVRMPGKVLMQQGAKSGTGAQITMVVPIITTPGVSASQSPSKRSEIGSPQSKITSKTASPAKQVKKINSLGLFFRKVYHLASVRLVDLCQKLNISVELQKKIWTCFEYTLINRLFLMKDRHLDQMLMCAIYVMSKVTKEDKTFHDIMRCYRQQPQANSDVYRQVFLSRKETPKTESATSKSASQGATVSSTPEKNDERLEEQKLTPTRSTRSATRAKGVRTTPDRSTDVPSKMARNQDDKTEKPEYEEKHGDLIEFYNLVYVKEIKDFAMKFSQKGSHDVPPLSPLPVRRKHTASPRKVSNLHKIYISPIKDAATTPRSHLLYCIEESPVQRLQDINRMIKQGKVSEGTRRKISLMETDEDSGPSPSKKLYESKLQALNKR